MLCTVLDLLGGGGVGGLGGVKPPQSFFKPSQLVHFFIPMGSNEPPQPFL